MHGSSGTPHACSKCNKHRNGLAVTNQLLGRVRQRPDSCVVTVHFGARLGAFFYWTRFIWQCIPCDNTIPFIWSTCSENKG